MLLQFSSRLGYSATTLFSCFALLVHLTAYKWEIKDFLKLPSATSFICRTLVEICTPL